MTLNITQGHRQFSNISGNFGRISTAHAQSGYLWAVPQNSDTTVQIHRPQFNDFWWTDNL